jgi:hypothetical protein
MQKEKVENDDYRRRMDESKTSEQKRVSDQTMQG